MHWFSLILGILIGWLIEWLIDFFYWRRRYQACLRSRAELETQFRTAQADLIRARESARDAPRLQAQLSAARARIGELEAQLAASSAAAAPTEPVATRAPAVVPVAGTASQPDDLEIIEGIGPAIARLLHDNSINTYADLAAATPAALKAILDAAGPRFRMAHPQTWPQQADLAARGDWAGLKDLQARLAAGRA